MGGARNKIITILIDTIPAISPPEKHPMNNPANAAINADRTTSRSNGMIWLTAIFIQTQAVKSVDRIPPANPKVIF